jgi:hypothetical protein
VLPISSAAPAMIKPGHRVQPAWSALRQFASLKRTHTLLIKNVRAENGAATATEVTEAPQILTRIAPTALPCALG